MDLEKGPVKDFPLLWKVYDHIVAHPEEWNQVIWASRGQDWVAPTCDTAFCFAGHAVTMSHPTARTVWGWADERGEERLSTNDISYYVEIDGKIERYDAVAQRDLGLTLDEAGDLFGANNDLDTIHRHLLKWEQDDQESWLSS